MTVLQAATLAGSWVRKALRTYVWKDLASICFKLELTVDEPALRRGQYEQRRLAMRNGAYSDVLLRSLRCFGIL